MPRALPVFVPRPLQIRFSKICLYPTLVNICKPGCPNIASLGSAAGRTTCTPLPQKLAEALVTEPRGLAQVESGGYSGHDDVTVTPPHRNDKQESFWLAETLKYLYLLYSPSDVIPLATWVFNTEAHPLKVMAVSQAASQTVEIPKNIN